MQSRIILGFYYLKTKKMKSIQKCLIINVIKFYNKLLSTEIKKTLSIISFFEYKILYY